MYCIMLIEFSGHYKLRKRERKKIILNILFFFCVVSLTLFLPSNTSKILQGGKDQGHECGVTGVIRVSREYNDEENNVRQ